MAEGQTNERIAYLKARISANDRTEMAKQEIDMLNQSLTSRCKEPLEATDELIADILESWDQEDVQ